VQRRRVRAVARLDNLRDRALSAHQRLLELAGEREAPHCDVAAVAHRNQAHREGFDVLLKVFTVRPCRVQARTSAGVRQVRHCDVVWTHDVVHGVLRLQVLLEHLPERAAQHGADARVVQQGVSVDARPQRVQRDLFLLPHGLELAINCTLVERVENSLRVRVPMQRRVRARALVAQSVLRALLEPPHTQDLVRAVLEKVVQHTGFPETHLRVARTRVQCGLYI